MGAVHDVGELFGGHVDEDGVEAEDLERATELAEAAMGRPLTPADVSAYWTRQALAFIRAEPLAWAKLLGRKFALLWNRSEMLDTESLQSHAEWSTPVRLGSYVGHFGVLVPLAFLGLVLTWPSRGRLWVIYGLLTVYAAMPFGVRASRPRSPGVSPGDEGDRARRPIGAGETPALAR